MIRDDLPLIHVVLDVVDAPQKHRFCGDPALDSNGRAKPAHFKVLPMGAKHLDAGLPADYSPAFR